MFLRMQLTGKVCFKELLALVDSRDFQPFHLDLIGGDLGDVVIHLLGEPACGAAAEGFGEADGHFRRDAAPCIDEFRQ